MTISFFHVLFISFFFPCSLLRLTFLFLFSLLLLAPKGELQRKKDWCFLRPPHDWNSPSALLSLPPLPIRPKASWILGANCEWLSNFTPPPFPPLLTSQGSKIITSILWAYFHELISRNKFLRVPNNVTDIKVNQTEESVYYRAARKAQECFGLKSNHVLQQDCRLKCTCQNTFGSPFL